MNEYQEGLSWTYYIETAAISNILVLMFLGVALQGILMDTWPAWIDGADYSQLWWPLFFIHMATATLFSILWVWYDMNSPQPLGPSTS